MSIEHFSDIIGSMTLENAGSVLILGLLCFIRGCARFFLFVGKRSCALMQLSRSFALITSSSIGVLLVLTSDFVGLT